MTIESLADFPSVAAYLKRIGAEPRSLKTAVIKEMSGNYWKDLAKISFDKSGKCETTDSRFDPTETEKAAIEAEFQGVKWPKLKPLMRLINLPDMIKKADSEHVFEFKNEHGEIIMVQVRIEIRGERKYIPWTYWDDDTWRISEPDGHLPLWGLENIKNASTVFIHEGAKAARKMQRMVSQDTAKDSSDLAYHPWGRELSGAIHLGWIGGALSPSRTDWSALVRNGIKRVYIVADNDAPGRSAVPAISMQVRIPTFTVQFTDEFPASFDLADDFPKKMFAKMEGNKHYIGPAFRDCIHPATWATDLVQNKKGKPSVVLRDSFKNMWAYVEEADLFVCTEMPEIMRTESILNKMLSAYSHTAETCKLIVKNYRGRSTRLCYRPDHDGLTVTFRGSSAINLHVKSTIRSFPGDPKPWLDFLDYMFVKESERKEVTRWCATLIAKPTIRMNYGMLLVSEVQGSGKGTLVNSVLAPLVGPNNVSFPSEGDIISPYNYWIANKRLISVAEIYSGHSWKAYNTLKTMITDKDIVVNMKYMPQYTIDNWGHFVVCSNSMRALKMENGDRRWLYPEITEVLWPKHKFEDFHEWLSSGGLSIIKHWAENYGHYVSPSERAPMTDRKLELIEGSKSEAQKEASALASSMVDYDRPAAILIKEVVEWVRQSSQGRVFDTDYELRKVMLEAGLHSFQKRIKVSGRLQYVITNDLLMNEVQRLPEDDQTRRIRECIIRPTDLLQEGM